MNTFAHNLRCFVTSTLRCCFHQLKKNCHVSSVNLTELGEENTVHRGVATCTHGRTCVPEKMLDLFVAHVHRKRTYKKLFQSLLGRTIEHYFFAYKQLSNLLSLHSYTFSLVCLV